MKLASCAALTMLLLVLPRASLADQSLNALLKGFAGHCLVCHGEGDNVEGNVDLRVLESADDLSIHAGLLLKVRKVLADRQMPPNDEPPLAEATRAQMIGQLRTILTKTLKTYPFEPTPIRRMNRFGFNNAVVDLLELDRDIFQLNERLLRRREDYFRPATKRMPETVRVSSRPLSKDIDNERPEGFKGVAAFPQDKRAEHGFDNQADHLTMSPLLMEAFLKLSQSIVESPDLNPAECRSWDRLFAPPGQSSRGPVEGRYEAEPGGPLKVVGSPKGRVSSQKMNRWGSRWSGHTQLLWICRQQDLQLAVAFEVAEAGTGLAFGFTKAPDYGTFAIHLDGQKIGEPVNLFDPKVVRADDVAVTGLKIGRGPHVLTFECVGKDPRSSNFLLGIDYVEVVGRDKSTPGGSETQADRALRSRIRRLLRRAFRQPVDAELEERFTSFARRQIAGGASFESTMRTVVGAVIAMPDFLYLYESGSDELGNGSKARQRVTDFELATRLSQFFWSSIPDERLLDLAEAGQLSDPETLSAQIDRMMNDRRASRFCDNFPTQWLQLERLVTSVPDRKKFPYFYYQGYRTSMHMMSEPLLLFETVFVEDRSVMDLIDPGFTWQSDMLRQNYNGQSNAGRDVKVQTFKRVPLDDPRRGGVITNAAVMTMTSTPTRTQPITRGAWINEVIFNDPPEPPPADVPPLPEVDRAELEKLTIRERLSVHRKRADCAGCHNKIDPLGFALENFGPTGVWRDTYENGRPVDASGELFNRSQFKTVDQFKRIIVEDKRRFLRGFIAHALSYALARQLGPADSPALDDMTEAAVHDSDRMRDILKRVAMSEPFLHKNVSTISSQGRSK